MTNKYKLPLAFFAIVMLFLSSCKKDDPVILNPEELITTVTFILIPQNGGDDVEFIFRDLDGDGGEAPVIINGTLKTNTIYNGTLELLNETETPAGNITEEIEEEDEDHQFFFSISNGLNLNIEYNDADANNNPVGLASLATSGEVSQGQLTIILRHEPDKSAADVSDGDITNAGGETDIEVTFEVDIQ